MPARAQPARLPTTAGTAPTARGAGGKDEALTVEGRIRSVAVVDGEVRCRRTRGGLTLGALGVRLRTKPWFHSVPVQQALLVSELL